MLPMTLHVGNHDLNLWHPRLVLAVTSASGRLPRNDDVLIAKCTGKYSRFIDTNYIDRGIIKESGGPFQYEKAIWLDKEFSSTIAFKVGKYG